MRTLLLGILVTVLFLVPARGQAPAKTWTFRPAWKRYEAAVKAGDGVAMMRMAEEASACGCAPTDEWVDWESEALPGLEKAVAAGDARAMVYLATILSHRDPGSERAHQVFMGAVALEDERALDAYAAGFSPDVAYETYSRLFDIYLQKAEAGDPVSMIKLITMMTYVIERKLGVSSYESEDYVQKMSEFQQKWYLKAIELGYAHALVLLGSELKREDPEAAVNNYTQAVQKGDCGAYYALAEFYAERDGGFRDGGKAMEWLQKAKDYLGCWSPEMDNMVQEWADVLQNPPAEANVSVAQPPKINAQTLKHKMLKTQKSKKTTIKRQKQSKKPPTETQSPAYR